MGQLTRAAYQRLIDENIAWLLENTERSLERDHIVDVLRYSVDHIYGPKKPTLRQVQDLEFMAREVRRRFEERRVA